MMCTIFFFSSRRRHTRSLRDWSSDVCSSDLPNGAGKSTTLKAISNLIRSERGKISRGSIRWQGQDIAERDPSSLVSEGLDRKSTRLNSSHVETAYTVLCLKKKIPGTERPTGR